LGAGIVLAELQQHSDATFRLFDYGRGRELHEDNGVAVANAWPLRSAAAPVRLTNERTVLVASRHFVFEKFDLPAGSSWALQGEPETWMLVLDGHAAIGLATVAIGQAVFLGGGRTSIEVGLNGLTALVAYPASAPIAALLQTLGEPSTRAVPRTPGALPELTDLTEAQA
jgi:mannose-6-phosphate isomerase